MSYKAGVGRRRSIGGKRWVGAAAGAGAGAAAVAESRHVALAGCRPHRSRADRGGGVGARRGRPVPGRPAEAAEAASPSPAQSGRHVTATPSRPGGRNRVATRRVFPPATAVAAAGGESGGVPTPPLIKNALPPPPPPRPACPTGKCRKQRAARLPRILLPPAPRLARAVCTWQARGIMDRCHR
ncbi:CASP-like protein 4A2 [Schistocerca americana]|uniref:CASP-like protein 4A2 n=1 Tax=Schistocerca americana TaxID=7009 RepID=UPI001F4FCA77|nr:CASP-like protein 4A2 [Schistocerca americana]